jgi:hypothetical protein
MKTYKLEDGTTFELEDDLPPFPDPKSKESGELKDIIYGRVPIEIDPEQKYEGVLLLRVKKEPKKSEG